MGYRWRVVKEEQLGYGRLEGVVTGQDVLAAADAFVNDPEWKPGDRLLWDNRHITKLAIKPKEAAEILRLAMSVGEYVGESKAAAVISSDLRMMGEHLIQMSGMDEENVRLFGSIDEAAAWLGIPVEALNTGPPGRTTAR